MMIEVAVDHVKHAWDVEILVSAEHKHDFVARESGATAAAAMDACVHKIEQQLRKYKERVQNHKGEANVGGSTFLEPEAPQSSGETGSDLDEV
jgi:putative sigma-54 modulation protein